MAQALYTGNTLVRLRQGLWSLQHEQEVLALGIAPRGQDGAPVSYRRIQVWLLALTPSWRYHTCVIV